MCKIEWQWWHDVGFFLVLLFYIWHKWSLSCILASIHWYLLTVNINTCLICHVAVCIFWSKLLNLLCELFNCLLNLPSDASKFSLITQFHHQVNELLLLHIQSNLGRSSSPYSFNVSISDFLIKLILYVLLWRVYLVYTDEHVTESLLDYVLKHLSVLWDLYFVIILILTEDAWIVLLLERV